MPLVATNAKVFCVGPVEVSRTTKEVMVQDVAAIDPVFCETVQDIRNRLVQLAGPGEIQYTCVPIQGVGTYALEAVISTVTPREGGKILVLENGAFGRRPAQICKAQGIAFQQASFAVDQVVSPQSVADILRKDGSFSMVCVVHVETSTGAINPVEDIGRTIKEIRPDVSYMVDAMCSFGGVELNVSDARIDYLVFSANKCLQGVPGVAFALCNKSDLMKWKDNARVFSLDLFDQWQFLEATGNLRMTPPVHVLLALKQALLELEAEGGIAGRAQKFKRNCSVLRQGMRALGFSEVIDESISSDVLIKYRFPAHPNYKREVFWETIKAKGEVIFIANFPWVDGFRIGTMGNLGPEDFHRLLGHIRETCDEMGIPVPIDF